MTHASNISVILNTLFWSSDLGTTACLMRLSQVSKISQQLTFLQTTDMSKVDTSITYRAMFTLYAYYLGCAGEGNGAIKAASSSSLWGHFQLF